MAERKVTRSSPLLGALGRGAVALFSRLPLGGARACGTLLGRLAVVLPNDLRKATRLNLAWCFPQLSTAERRRLEARSLIETGRTLAETGALLGWAPARLAALEEEVAGEELLHRAVGGGRGVLILLPHLGNWEMLNPFLMGRYPFAALYRPPKVAELSRLVVEARERTGCRMIPATTTRGLRQLHRAIAEGKPVIVLPDQEPVRQSGVFAPFFGVPALTMTLVSRLMRRLGVPALFAFTLRSPGGGFRFFFHAPPDGLDDPDPEIAAGRLNLGVERCVRECPEQYMWSYKRFKTRPPEEEHRLRALGDPTRVRLYDRRKGLPSRTASGTGPDATRSRRRPTPDNAPRPPESR